LRRGNNLELRITIAGFGGQGILFFGRILAYAGMLERKQVTFFPSYGAEVRGGTANCTVIISDALIGSPIITDPDMLIIMNDASLERFQPRLRPRGLLIFDSSLIKEPALRDDIVTVGIPATDLSRTLGETKSANMVMLGSFIARTKLLEVTSAFTALENSMDRGGRTIEINKRAILEGMRFLEDKKGQDS